MSIWDDPDMKVSNDYVTFLQEGDTITLDLIKIGAKRWDDGSVSPELLGTVVDGAIVGTDVEVGSEKTVTAGAVRLKAELAEKRPEAGDRVKITLTKIEKRGGGKELKHWDVEVTGGVPAAKGAAAAAPAAAAPTPDAAAASAAAAALTPEQRKALGL